jgi:hypothetical protein
MHIAQETLDWLLEKDNPSVRYLTLQTLADAPAGELEKARKAAYRDGAIGMILDQMHPDGYWVEPGPSYNPKYKSSVWSLITLAQLGAHSTHDWRIQKACAYYMDHAFRGAGFITTNGTPSGTVDCLQGNMCAALTVMGIRDPRLDEAFEWLAKSNTGDGVIRYYAAKSGAGFQCGANNNHPCAWGATKALLALSAIPAAQRTPLMRKAIGMGVDFVFSCDPATALYPTPNGARPNSSWFKLGFPVFYITDVLQIVEVLTSLGYGDDPRLRNAVQLILGKRDSQDRWLLEYSYASKTWLDVGEKKQPSKWVTFRALKALKNITNA